MLQQCLKLWLDSRQFSTIFSSCASTFEFVLTYIVKSLNYLTYVIIIMLCAFLILIRGHFKPSPHNIYILPLSLVGCSCICRLPFSNYVNTTNQYYKTQVAKVYNNNTVNIYVPFVNFKSSYANMLLFPLHKAPFHLIYQ